MNIRQCIICGDQWSIKKYFSYSKGKKKSTYCKECNEDRQYFRTYEGNHYARLWAEMKRDEWGYIPREKRPDIEVFVLPRDIPNHVPKLSIRL